MTSQIAAAPSHVPMLLRRATFASLTVAALGFGLGLMYWGAVGAVTLVEEDSLLILLAPVSAAAALLPVVTALAALTATLTDRPSAIRWALVLAAVEAAALGLSLAAVALFG